LFPAGLPADGLLGDSRPMSEDVQTITEQVERRLPKLDPLLQALWNETWGDLLDAVTSIADAEPAYVRFLREHRGLPTWPHAEFAARLLRKTLVELKGA